MLPYTLCLAYKTACLALTTSHDVTCPALSNVHVLCTIFPFTGYNIKQCCTKHNISKIRQCYQDYPTKTHIMHHTFKINVESTKDKLDTLQCLAKCFMVVTDVLLWSRTERQ